MIEKYFALGEKWNVKIDYIRETHALGTAGALSLLNPAPVEPVLVTNGDVLTDIKYGDLLDFHIANDSVATMAVKPHEVHNPFGVVKIDGDQIMGVRGKARLAEYNQCGNLCAKSRIAQIPHHLRAL